MSTEPVRSTCPYCGVGCGVLAGRDGTVVGDPAHPANFGLLCSKGTALGETLVPQGRLLHPEINGQRAGWDEALDLLAGRFRDTIAEHGPGSVALYVSGQLLTEDYYAANKLAKAVLGTPNIDSNSRLCMASAVAGHRRGFGEDVVPGIYEDLELADLLVLVGSNTAWCHPVLFRRIEAARAARPGMRVVVVDPRRTATCEGADLHLPLLPGSDVALFTGLLADLARRGLVSDALGDTASALAAAQVATPDLASTALLTGLDPGDLATFFTWFAATPRSVTLFSQGVNQSSAGTDKVGAILNVHLATGRIGLPGAGPFSITGQPNAMGGRETGALANMLAAHLEYDVPGDADTLAAFWRTDRLPRTPGLKAVELMQAVAERRVRAIWIMGTNPAISLPRADAVREALRGCDFVAVSDCMRETDTADLAHLRLPALGWGEKDGTVTNSERMISRQRAFRRAPGEARPDWWMAAQMARRLGGVGFDWRGPADIFREHAALSGTGRKRVFDISPLAGLGDADYAAMAPTRWPIAGPARLFAARLFADGRFPTPDGRAVLPAIAPRPAAETASADWPLVLLTGRLRDQWHTMTRTGLVPRLLAHQPEPTLSMHPDDAASLRAGGLEAGGLVRVSSPHGSAVLRLTLDDGQRRGTVFAPMHWTDRFCPDGRINAVVSSHVDPISGQPELKATPVAVAAHEAGWHGFMLGEALPEFPRAWHATIPLGHGFTRHELAGSGTPENAFAALLGQMGEGETLLLRDASAGRYRAVILRGGRLAGAVFVGPDSGLPPRDWLAGLLGEPVTGAMRQALLAGHLPGRVSEPMLCVCHGVAAGAVRAAIAAGASTLTEIGAATRAGTGCGSCKPELRQILAARAREVVVA